MEILSPASAGTAATATNGAALAIGAATIMPTGMSSQQQSIYGVEPFGRSQKLRAYHPDATSQIIRHPRQAPSAITSEQFFSARQSLSPSYQHNASATKASRISNLYADAPRYSAQIDILA